MNRVTICIVVKDTFKMLKDCLEQVKKSTKIGYDLKVLDLGDDGTYYWCKEQEIDVQKHDPPCYFSQSCNLLVKDCKTEYILFLNPDTLVYPKFLEYLIAEADEDKKIGVVGSRLMYPNGTIQHSGTTWDAQEEDPGDKGYMQRMHPDFLVPRDVTGVSGASMLVRREYFNKCGGFDEKFKNGYEDLDLCLTMAKNKYRVRYCGRSAVTHYRGSTLGTEHDIPTAGEFLPDNIKYLKKKWRPPHKTYTIKTYRNYGSKQNRVMLGTAMTGNIRAEWYQAMQGAIKPTNWSNGWSNPVLPMSTPLDYLTPDAQNIIVRDTLMGNYEWLILIEQDNLVQADVYIRFNDYMMSYEVPVVSGLYFTKGVPPEPMIYMKAGESYKTKWKMGEKIWCWGVPTGCILIHHSILQAMWDETPEYHVWGNVLHRVFEAPAKVFKDPVTGQMSGGAGTSDLEFCDQVQKRHIFEKSGWRDIAKKKYPFLVDTNIFTWHIHPDGTKYPLEIPEKFR
jgi:GT2 family glycosyltransferase